MKRSFTYTLLICAGLGVPQSTPSVTLPEPQASLGITAGALMTMPYDLCTVGPDTILVADKRAQEILTFNRAGEYLGRIGGPGQGPGEFADLNSLVYTNGWLLASDDDLNRVSAFRTDGRFIRSWMLPDSPKSLVAWRGRVLVATLRGSSLIWSITLDEDYAVVPFVDRDEVPAEFHSEDYRSLSALLAIHGDDLFVAFREAPSILHWDLSDRRTTPRIVTPSGPAFDLQRKDLESRRAALPPQAVGNVGWVLFQGVQVLPTGDLVVEVLLPDTRSASGRTGAAIRIDGTTGKQTGPVVYPHTPAHWRLRLLGDTMLSWMNADEAVVDLYVIPRALGAGR